MNRQVKHSPRPELELSSCEDGVILALKAEGENTLKNEKTPDDSKKNGEKKPKTENYITKFRQNIDREMAQKDWTIRETSEYADMPFETLKNFLYDKEAKDCRLSTVIKLSKAFGLGMDELVGSGTYSDQTLEMIRMYRSLPESSRSLIRWHIEDQMRIRTKASLHRTISVMLPVCSGNGNLTKTSVYEELELTGEQHPEVLHKVFFGIKIPCNHYLPHYMENDILLLANDREPLPHEVVVLVVGNFIALAKRKVENGKVKYYGLRDGIFRAEASGNIRVIGYIAKVITE